MSAIAGIFNFNQGTVLDEHSSNMMRALEKFPADDIQTWQGKEIFLGCHAQWITPESEGEKLPFYSEERRLAITADAIIDNRLELFESLQISIKKQQMITDSELILLSYEKWGEEAPNYLIGDFAFLIWDEKKKQIFGARDFSGSRTLYYYRNKQQIAFCTTIQPLLSLPYVKKVINEDWLSEFLVIPNMIDALDTNLTVYKDILQLPPSHSIIVNRDSIKLKRYSNIGDEKKLVLKSDNEYEEAFLDVFQTAVKARTRTKHKVGAHLSGGLDSGSVVSMASRSLVEENKKLYTYSYVPEEGFLDWTPKHRIADERPLIKSTVNHVGNIADTYLDFKGSSPLDEIDEWLDMMEMPYKFFENSFWVKGIFEQAKNDGIKSLLSGQRGNFTISWGPALAYYATLLKQLSLMKLTKEIHAFSKRKNADPSKVMKAVTKKAFPSIENLLSNKQSYQFPTLINSNFAKKTDIYRKVQEYDFDITGTKKVDNFEIRKKHFNHLYHWNATGTSATKLSLRYSLWNRDPTNDLRVVRFCLSVPEGKCVTNGFDRALIRKSMFNYLPDNVRLNQRTRGIQGADWLHRMIPNWDSFTNEISQLLKDEAVLTYFNRSSLETAFNKTKTGVLPNAAFDPDFRTLMRALIIYRFLKMI
ncbi:asparagine synthase-related protein [Metabacillus litoralis]|uniref:asparagine synthase-related protein n=1 Tax=Metabacillus litoralis TaxID=152268 RepID=UPI001CFE807C|nr:asparagine synthase-related protein [Metabacillus litoralis]